MSFPPVIRFPPKTAPEEFEAVARAAIKRSGPGTAPLTQEQETWLVDNSEMPVNVLKAVYEAWGIEFIEDTR